MGEPTAAIVPCLNEAAFIGAVVTGVRAWVDRVLVVDDGSSDATSAVARAAGAEVLRLRSRSGKGAALAAGWHQAARWGVEWVLLLDGDGQHDPADAPSFFEAGRTGARLVIGNRMTTPATMPWLRRRTNEWVSRRLSSLGGIHLPDALCGYRLVHLGSLLELGLHSRNYEIESEMTVAFARRGHPIAFVPVRTRYGFERSKISPLRDTWRWFRWYAGSGGPVHF